MSVTYFSHELFISPFLLSLHRLHQHAKLISSSHAFIGVCCLIRYGEFLPILSSVFSFAYQFTLAIYCDMLSSLNCTIFGRAVKLTTHVHLVTRLTERGAIHPLHQYVFIAYCLVKHRDKFTFMLLNNVI
jgi:hypothetical protein